MRITRTRWFLPAVAVFFGFVTWGSMWAGGRPYDGAIAALVLFALAAALLFGGRSETIRGFRGDGRDERFKMLDISATAFAGNATILVILGCVFWEYGHGRDGTPYSDLAAVAGVSYLAAFAWMRWRG
jgi:hypothetical protein